MIACIFGRTGSGKSTLFKRMVRASARAIVIDPKNEHQDLGACPESMEDFLAYWKANYRLPRWHIVLQQRHLRFRAKPREALEPYLRKIAWNGRNFIVGIDEIDQFIGLHVEQPDVMAIINLGRASGVHLIGCARRAQRVHPDFLSQASDLYVFQMTRPGDCEYLEEYIGGDAVAACKALQTHEYIHWNVDGSIVLGKAPPCSPA